MNNKLKLVLFAITPFIIGNIVNALIMRAGWYGTSMLIISILFFIYWFITGYISTNYSKSALEAVLVCNSFAIISVGSLLLSGIIFMQAQMFFLPSIRVTSKILAIFGGLSSNGVFLGSCIFMIVVYYFGYRTGKKKTDN